MFTKIKNFLNGYFKKPEPVVVIPAIPEVLLWRFMPYNLQLDIPLELGMPYSIFVIVDNVPVAKYFDIVGKESNFARTCNLINHVDSNTLLNFNKPLNIRCTPGKVDIDVTDDIGIVASFKDIDIDHEFK